MVLKGTLDLEDQTIVTLYRLAERESGNKSAVLSKAVALLDKAVQAADKGLKIAFVDAAGNVIE